VNSPKICIWRNTLARRAARGGWHTVTTGLELLTVTLHRYPWKRFVGIFDARLAKIPPEHGAKLGRCKQIVGGALPGLVADFQKPIFQLSVGGFTGGWRRRIAVPE